MGFFLIKKRGLFHVKFRQVPMKPLTKCTKNRDFFIGKCSHCSLEKSFHKFMQNSRMKGVKVEYEKKREMKWNDVMSFNAIIYQKVRLFFFRARPFRDTLIIDVRSARGNWFFFQTQTFSKWNVYDVRVWTLNNLENVQSKYILKSEKKRKKNS